MRPVKRINDWIREPVYDTPDPIGNALGRMNKAIIVYFGIPVLLLALWRILL